MDSHTFAAEQVGTVTVAIDADGPVVRSTVPHTQGALVREILRLAQREADLAAEVARLERLAEERRVAIEGMERLVTEREHQLALAKETAATLRELDVNRQRVILGLREQLAASESRGRQYCLELAEKAGRIRELEEALGRALSDAGRLKREAAHQGTRMAAEDRVDELKAILREHGLLPAKYEDEEGGPRVQATAASTGQHFAQGEVPDAGPRIWRGVGVADAEQNLERLDASVNPDGKPPARVRLESLEESRGTHARILTDHARRLKAAEHFQAQQHERMVHIERLGGRLAAMDEGLRRLDLIEEELRRHDRIRIEHGEQLREHHNRLAVLAGADLDALLARVGAIENSLAPAEGDQ